MGPEKSEDYSSGPPPRWQQLFAQHLTTLHTHLELWNDLQGQHSAGTTQHEAAKTCLSNTEEMIRNFEKLQTTFENHNSAQDIKTVSSASKRTLETVNGEEENQTDDASPSRASKRTRTNHAVPQSTAPQENPVTDDSGLFVIDTNPTPLEQLLAQNSSSGGRASKSVAPGTRNGASSIQEQDKHNEDNGDDDFLTRAAKRHDEKEAARARKQDKKRKRTSNVSLEEHASGNVKPLSKKRRKELEKTAKTQAKGSLSASDNNPKKRKPATDSDNKANNSTNGQSKSSSKKRKNK